MKKRQRKYVNNFPDKSCAKRSNERYRPLSYYVLGGVNLDGKPLVNNTPVSYDNEETLTELENSEQGLQSIGACDPRVDFFDIAEASSKSDAKKATEKGGQPQVKTETESVE